MSQEDDEYFLPLQDQRVFGAGIKRKRVPFVPAESEPTSASEARLKPGLGDRYLSIVLPRRRGDEEVPREQNQEPRDDDLRANTVVCAVCELPMTPDTSAGAAKPHESSLAHQLCLSHSYPPSYLDRKNIGLKYLSSYGWDPDARSGLGASGTGIRVPIKSKIKNDTVGLGVTQIDRVRVHKETRDKKKLNAKEVRKREAEGKKREMQLRDAFYGRDLEAYLVPEG